MNLLNTLRQFEIRSIEKNGSPDIEIVRGLVYRSNLDEIKEALEYETKTTLIINHEFVMWMYDRWMFLSDFSLESINRKLIFLSRFLDDYEEEIAKLNKIKSCMEK